MSEANKALVLRLIEEAINKGNFKVWTRFFQPTTFTGSLRREKGGAGQATKK